MDSTEKTAGGDLSGLNTDPSSSTAHLPAPTLFTYLLARTLHPLSVCLDDVEDDKFRRHGRRRFK